MKAVILAAGEGSRMELFSQSTPKVMLRFRGKPLVAHHVDELLKNRIKDIIIICSPSNLREIKEYFDRNYKKLKFHYCIQKKQLGPAHALLSTKKYLKNSYFILRYGDSATKEDQIKGILNAFKKSGGKKSFITLKETDIPRECGVAKFKDKKLIEIVEKPKEKIPSKLANMGLSIIDADLFFSLIKKQGYKKVIPPIQYLLQDEKPVGYWISKLRQIDVGRPHNILSTNKLYIEKLGGKIESDRVSKNAKISKKAYISSEAIIDSGAIIGDYSAIYGHVGKGTNIKNSVIMEGTTIGEKCDIKNSIIGKNNRIGDKFRTKIGKTNIYIKGKYVSPGMSVGLFTGEKVVIKKNLISEPGKMVFPNQTISENIKEDKLPRKI